MAKIQSWEVSDAFWEKVEPLIPAPQRDPSKMYKRKQGGGRKPIPSRRIFEAIIYVLRTGCQWKAMPKEFGSGSAIHAYFQEWVELGVFAELWRLALLVYDDLKGIDWKWQSMDGAMTKSPLGGEKNREKPDRSWQTGRQTLDSD